MLAKVESACLVGMEVAPVHVEVNLAKGLPYFSIVGLPDASVREAKDRVVAAIRNAGFEFPSRRVTVNLAPADLRKEGSCFDLAIAVGILLASKAVNPSKWPRSVWLGELALDGTLRPVRGVLPLVRSLSLMGLRQVVLPTGNAEEICFLPGVRSYPFHNLRDVASWLNGESATPIQPARSVWAPGHSDDAVDFSEIKGQPAAKRALEIAAAGGHNLMMVGCPGTGKSLLAQALPKIMPKWTIEEALDASQVHSVTGSLRGLLPKRPFRSPHHTVSSAALIGGGDIPMPGEISLAHRGVLFLDELPEFRRDALEAMRQPLEEGLVHIRRTRGQASFPAQCLVVAAMNPCPCGFRGHSKRECLCPPLRIQKYMSRISGPFLDRMDLQIEIPAVRSEELFEEGAALETSDRVRERVERARTLQRQRYRNAKHYPVNAMLRGASLRQHAALDDGGKMLLKTAMDRLGFSARAFDRIRKVARTIADLDGKLAIEPQHLAEAIQYRALDRTAQPALEPIYGKS
jgi:magnesium chelatase family protein